MRPSKRRRIGDPTCILKRPFRSPIPSASHKTGYLHNGPIDQAQREGTENPGSLDQQPKPVRSTDTSTLPDRSVFSSPPATREPRSSSIKHTLPPPARSPHDTEYVILQKQHSALVLQLKQLDNSINTSSQALRILTSKKDADLETLIAKWQITARDAAEELFTTAKDKVNRMGGVSAWREKFQRSKSDVEDNDSWGLEQEIDEDELTTEQKEQLEILREETRREVEKYGLHEKPNKLMVERDDDSFTMDMMLKQLNVDLDVIGYDARAQQWMD